MAFVPKRIDQMIANNMTNKNKSIVQIDLEVAEKGVILNMNCLKRPAVPS